MGPAYSAPGIRRFCVPEKVFLGRFRGVRTAVGAQIFRRLGADPGIGQIVTSGLIVESFLDSHKQFEIHARQRNTVYKDFQVVCAGIIDPGRDFPDRVYSICGK